MLTYRRRKLLTNLFSVVHLRLLMCVIKEDPKPVLNTLISMLSKLLFIPQLILTTHLLTAI